MIQAAMYFALGLLAAGLLSLLVMPAIWRRAARLTRARVEAAMPMSLAEIEADKDQLRANFAVTNRRLEMEATALKERLAGGTIEVGRGRDEISALTRARAALADTVAGLEERVAELSGGLSTAENKLATANTEIAARDERLTQQAANITELREQLYASQVMTEEQRLELVARATEIGNLTDSIAGMTASGTVTEAGRDKLAAELALERDRLVAEQKRADGLSAGLAALQAERISRIADLERREADLKALESTLAAERERSSTLAAEIAALKAHQVDAMTEGDNFRKAMAATESERESLAVRIASLEGDYAALRAENAELQRVAGAEWESEREENRRLRERLSEIAAGVVRLTQSLDSGVPARTARVDPLPAAPSVAGPEPDETPLADSLASGTRH